MFYWINRPDFPRLAQGPRIPRYQIGASLELAHYWLHHHVQHRREEASEPQGLWRSSKGLRDFAAFCGLAAMEREGQSRKTILELIIGNRHVKPTEIHRIDGGVEAILQGDALRSLLDVTFHGAGTIEILGGGLDRRPLEVRDIAMHGATTKVTLICTGPAPMLA